MKDTTSTPLARKGGRLRALMLMLASIAGLGLLAGPGIAQAETIVSIQFDDGISDQYQALPILAAHGMHGTFFINSAEVGTSGFYMNWSQVHDLADAGNEIGGHALPTRICDPVGCRGDDRDLRRPDGARQPGLHGDELRLSVRAYERLGGIDRPVLRLRIGPRRHGDPLARRLHRLPVRRDASPRSTRS